MPIELKQVLTFLGMDEKEVDDFDKFKNNFVGKYDTVDNLFQSESYNKKKAEINGAFITTLKKKALSNGVEIADNELKDSEGKFLPNDLIIEKLFGTFNENHKNTVQKIKSDFEANAGKGTKEWQEKYELADKRAKELEKVNEDIKAGIEGERKTFAGEIKKVKLQTKKADLFKSLAFKKDITPLEQAGFTSVFENKYELQLDDKDEIFITDKTGNRIANPATHGAFKSPQDVLKEEAVANKVFALNPDGGKPAANSQNNGGLFGNAFANKPTNNNLPPANGQNPPAGNQPNKIVLADRARAATGQ